MKRVLTINKKSVHHDYMKDLRVSNIMKPGPDYWHTVMSNKNLNTVDKYDVMLAQFER